MGKLRDSLNLATDERVEEEDDLKNDEWFKKNYLMLLQDYPNQWIAVWDQSVVCTGTSKRQVEEKAKKMMGERTYAYYFIDEAQMEVGLS